jgi:hypothetical protein
LVIPNTTELSQSQAEKKKKKKEKNKGNLDEWICLLTKNIM